MKKLIILFALLIITSFAFADTTSPVTTFSSFQVPNTTDQNITLTCSDNNTGCKTINYNINNKGWNNIYSDLIDETNLVAWWNFDETSGTNALDSFGSDHNGTHTNSLITTTSGIGKIGRDANYGGRQYYTTVAGVNGGSEETFTYWLYSDNYTTASQVFGGHLRAGGSDGWNLFNFCIQGNNVDVTLSNSVTHITYNGSTVLTNSNWYFVTIVVKDNSYVKSYINGVIDINSVLNYAPPNNRAGLVFGANEVAPEQTYYGYIDESSFWKRELSQSEITELYNSGNGITYTLKRFENNQYSFLYSGVGSHSIQYYSTDNNDNIETTSTDSFETFGYNHFYFYDEDTNEPISDVKIKVNDGAEQTSTGNYFGYNSEGDSGFRQFKFYKDPTDVANGYYYRYYEMEGTEYDDTNINIYLLKNADEETGAIAFKFYDSNGKETAPNTYVTVTYNGIITERRITSASGQTTFFLKEQDRDYNFNVEGEYDTGGGTIVLLQPRSELTGLKIDANWQVLITGSVSKSTKKVLEDENVSIVIIPNKLETYDFEVCVMYEGTLEESACDTTIYSKRTYVAMFYGDADGQTMTIQPWLAEGADDYMIIVKEKITGRILELATIEIYDTETRTKLLTSVQTDISGKAQVYLNSGERYYYYVTDRDGVLRASKGQETFPLFAIFGLDIPIWVDFEVTQEQQFATILTINSKYFNLLGENSTVDLNSTVNVLTKAYEVGITVLHKVYVNDVYNAGLSESKITSFLDYTLETKFQTDGNYDTNYKIEVYKAGQLMKTYNFRNITVEQQNARIEDLVTTNNMTFMLIVIIITMSIIMGALIGRGMEILLLLTIMLSLVNLNEIGIMISAILGVIYFIAPIIRDQFRS